MQSTNKTGHEALLKTSALMRGIFVLGRPLP